MSSNKNGSLKKCELQLRHALLQLSDTGTLKRAAEKVRLAKLGLLKKQERAIPPSAVKEELEAKQLVNIKKEQQHWETIPSENIILLYSDTAIAQKNTALDRVKKRGA